MFSTELFERYERSEKRPSGFAAANVSALMQMQVHGVSTRKVAKVTEALCGHGFSASTAGRINAKLDADLKQFAERPLEGSFTYLILDARYEKVREDGVVRDRAVLIAVGVDAAGRRQVLGVDLAEGESHASWRRFLESLRDRGLCGGVQVVSDDHSGLTKAIREVVPEAVRQRCYVHFLRNARAHLNRRSGDGCLKELRWIYDHPSFEEARADLAAWLSNLQLGRGDVRVSASSSAAPYSNALDEYARASRRGDQAADESRSDISGRPQLPEAGPGLVRRDPRELDGGRRPLPGHGSSSGAAAGRSAQAGGMTGAPFGPGVIARLRLSDARTAWKACGQSLWALLAGVLPGAGIDHHEIQLLTWHLMDR